MSEQECIFCSIVAGDSPADIVFSTDTNFFFREISPHARVHILGVPKKHIEQHPDTLATADVLALGTLIRDLYLAAQAIGVTESGFRLVINNGSDAGQGVNHLHVHLLGGEHLGPLKC